MHDVVCRYLCPRWIPARVLICVMMFTACWTSYMMRLQMPILVVPMIQTLPGESIMGACIQESNNRKRSVEISSTLNPLVTTLETHVYEETLKDYESELNFTLRRNNSDGLKDISAEESLGNDDVDGIQVRGSRQAEKQIRPPGIHLWNGLPFKWSPTLRGQLIAAYSYGNVPGNFLGGVASQKWGPKRAILWSSILAAILSLFTPIISQIHWSILIGARAITGVTGGITFPACHALVASWAPPNEKSRFIWALLGGSFGTIFTYPAVTAIASRINWEAAWYIPALLMFIWIIIFSILTYDSPHEHPAITDEEKEYILKAQEGSVRQKRPTMKETPIKAILTSVPFICLVICHFGSIFLIFFYQNVMILYLTKALGFQLTKGGFAASAPWAGRMVFGFFFCWAGDTIKKKQLLSVTALRKFGTIFSHFIPGLFLVSVGYSGCNFVLANVFLFFALSFNGAASVTNLSNNQDLSPNYAGFLYGIMNTIACSAGIIVSPLVEEIAGKHGHPIDRWEILFWIGALVIIVSMVVFIIGGSGEIQPWNEFLAVSTQPAAASVSKSPERQTQQTT